MEAIMRNPKDAIAREAKSSWHSGGPGMFKRHT